MLASEISQFITRVDEQPLKGELDVDDAEIVVTLAGMYILVKLVQFRNAFWPILLKLVALLKSILVRPVQPKKA